MKKLILFVGLLIFLCAGLWGVDYTWVGFAGGHNGDDVSWSDAGNWEDITDPGVQVANPPGTGTGDTATIDLGVPCTVLLDSDVIVTKLTIGDQVTLDLDNNDLNTTGLEARGLSSINNGTLTISNAGSLDVAGGVLDGDGNVTFGDGTLTMPMGADVEIVSLSGTFGTLITGTKNVSVVTTGTAPVTIGTIETTSGDVEITTTGASGSVSIGTITTTSGTGTKTLTANGTKTITVNTNTFDTVDVGGEITLADAITVTGGTTINSGATLTTASGTTSALGAVTINGGTLDLAGSTGFTLATLVSPATHTGTVIFRDNVGDNLAVITNFYNLNVTISNGARTVAGPLTIKGTTTVSGGSLSTLTTGTGSEFGALEVNGSGQVFTSNNNKLGNLTITAGTVSLGTDNSAGSVRLDGGTLSSNNYTFTVNGNWKSAANTFTAGSSTLVFNGSALGGATGTIETAASNNALNHITIEGNYRALSDITANNVTVNSGTLDMDTKNLTVRGNIIDSSTAATVNITNVAQLTLNGTVNQDINFGAAATVGSLVVNKSTGTANFAQALTVDGAISVANGTLNMSSPNVADRNLTVRGNIIDSSAATTVNITNVAQLTLDGGAAQAINFGDAATVDALRVRNTVDDVTFANALRVTGTVTIDDDATLAMDGNSLTLQGDLANNNDDPGEGLEVSTLLLSGGNPQNIDANNAIITTLTVNKTVVGTTATLTGDLTVTNDITLTNGTLNGGAAADNVVLTFGGTWNVGNGFTANAGTVAFTDGAVVTGDNTFNDVECSGTVNFARGTTQTINGTLDASGATLGPSSTTGTDHWKIASLTSGNFTTDSTTTISWCRYVPPSLDPPPPSAPLTLGRIESGTSSLVAHNGGNNYRVFAATTYTWIGEYNSPADWYDPGNWDAMGPPAFFPGVLNSGFLTTDTLKINTTEQGPTTPGAIEIESLDIQNGTLTMGDTITAGSINISNNTEGILKLNGHNIAWQGTPDLANDGTLISSGGETITGVTTIGGIVELHGDFPDNDGDPINPDKILSYTNLEIYSPASPPANSATSPAGLAVTETLTVGSDGSDPEKPISGNLIIEGDTGILGGGSQDIGELVIYDTVVIGDDVTLTVIRDITQNGGIIALGTITAPTGTGTIICDGEATQNGGEITGNTLILGGTGSFVLNSGVNNVAVIETDGVGGQYPAEISYTDTNGFEIGSTGLQTNATGTPAPANKITLVAGGAVTQTAALSRKIITGTLDVTANAGITLGSDNNAATVSLTNNGTTTGVISYTSDRGTGNPVPTVTVTATNSAADQAVTVIENSGGVIVGGVSSSAGVITLTGNGITGSGDISSISNTNTRAAINLTSSGSAVTIGGVVSGTNLTVNGGVAFTIENAGNDITGNLATGTTSPVSLSYKDKDGFTTGNITTTGSVTLEAGAASIPIPAVIQVGQDGTTTITTGTLTLKGDSGVTYTLDHENNNVAVLATSVSPDPVPNVISYRDFDDFDTGNIRAGTSVTLEAGSGTVEHLDGTTTITTGTLTLKGDGVIYALGNGNDVGTLATAPSTTLGRYPAEISYKDTSGFDIGQNGLQTTATGNPLPANTITLEAGDTVTQDLPPITPASGPIITGTLTLKGGGVTYTLNNENNNVAVLATSVLPDPVPNVISYRDFDDFDTGNIRAGTSVTLEAGSGTVEHLDGTTTITTGLLTLKGDSDVRYTLENGNNVATLETVPATSSGQYPEVISYKDTSGFDIGQNGLQTTATGNPLPANTITLVAGGAVTQTAALSRKIITGTLDVTAGGVITLASDNNVDIVKFEKNSTAGAVSYTSNRGTGNTVTVTANADGQPITITEKTGSITVGIEVSPNVYTGVTADRLALTAEQGTVTIDGAISVSGGVSEGPTAAVYVLAKTLTGSGAITLTNPNGAVCVWIEDEGSYTGTVTGGLGIHYHAYHDVDVVYRWGPDDPPYNSVGGTSVVLPQGSYLYYDASLNLGPVLNVETKGNIYIIDVDNGDPVNPALTRSLNFKILPDGNSDPNDYIEIRGAYKSSGTLVLDAPQVRLVNSAVNINEPATVTLENNPFELTSWTGGPAGNTTELNVRSIAGTTAVITAKNISLQTITGRTNRVNNLTLIAGGPDGDDGKITLAGAVGTSGTSGTSGIALGAVTVTNEGTFTTGAAGDIVAAMFKQNGAGDTSIAGDITVLNTTAADALIDFRNQVILAGNSIFTTPDSGGFVNLRGGETGGATYVLTLDTQEGIMRFRHDTDATVDRITVTSTGIGAVRAAGPIEFAADGKLDLNNGTWLMGAAGRPAGFEGGFYGADGEIIWGNDTELATRDFWFGPDTVPATCRFSIGLRNTITAFGSVRVNKTFTAVSPNTLTDTLLAATLRMTGNNKTITVKTNPSNGVPQVTLGNFVCDGSTTIDSNIHFLGSVTINENRTLSVRDGYSAANPGPRIQVEKDWTQEGAFEFKHSVVEFGDKDHNTGIPSVYTQGREFKIIGTTEWWHLVCNENRAVLKFSNWVDESSGHTIHGKLVIVPMPNEIPVLSPSDMNDPSKHTTAITLTRETDPGGYPNDPSYRPPDEVNGHFWYFILTSQATMELDEVIIDHSYSRTNIPLPKDGEIRWVSARPYVLIDQNSAGEELSPGSSYYYHLNYDHNRWCVNWFELNHFLYGFTEDANHNGKIDRIRLQAGFDLNNNFSDFEVAVKDGGKSYGVTGYRMVQEDGSLGSYDLDSIYVLLEENSEPDTNATLTWTITKNTSLKDRAMDFTLIENPPDDKDWGKNTTDTAAPRIGYALALPGLNEIFFQITEPLASPLTKEHITVPGFTVDTVSPVNDRETPDNAAEYIIKLGSDFNVLHLVNGASKFSVKHTDAAKMTDKAVPAKDLQSADSGETYFYMFPMPKYPQTYRYNIDEDEAFQPYVPVSGNPPVKGATHPLYWDTGQYPWADVTVIPLANPGYYKNVLYDVGPSDNEIVMDMTVSLDPSVPQPTHRVSDMLVSLPPSAIGDDYFVWPLWARYTTAPVTPSDVLGLHPLLPREYGYMGTDETEEVFSENDIIWDFTGKRFLERGDIEMQSRLGNKVSASSVVLLYAFNVPDEYRTEGGGKSAGLWHPGTSNLLPSSLYPSFTNMVPEYYSTHKTQSGSVGNSLFKYTFKDNEDYSANGELEFFYRIITGSSPEYLLAGRLDVPIGTAAKTLSGQSWYRWVRPFRFGVHDITRQRGGVTILNNVIKAGSERVFIDYRPESSGRVTIQVFTLDGNLVKILKRGSHIKTDDTYQRVSWDGTNNGGRAVARGMYFVRVVAPGIDEIRKVMVVK